VTNCAIHNGFGWGIYTNSAANLKFEGNTVFNFRAFGVNFNNAKDVIFDNNLVMHIGERTTFF